jgi:hypothetical protein
MPPTNVYTDVLVVVRFPRVSVFIETSPVPERGPCGMYTITARSELLNFIGMIEGAAYIGVLGRWVRWYLAPPGTRRSHAAAANG